MIHGPDSGQQPKEVRFLIEDTVTKVSIRFLLADGSQIWRGEVFPASLPMMAIITQWIAGGAAWSAPIIREPRELTTVSPTALNSLLMEREGDERGSEDDE